MDSGFNQDQTMSYAPNRLANDSTNEMNMMTDYYGLNSTAGMMFSWSSDMVNSSSGYAQIANSGGSVFSDMVPRFKHDAGFPVEWSNEEQIKLDEGISKYADEPTIMRYVKIAATLHDKTVRDVALRCSWIASKRRKQDELKSGSKLEDKKDKVVESMSKPSVSSISSLNEAPFFVTMNNRFQSNGTPLEALSVSTRHLLEQNNKVFGQIKANISSLKVA